MADKITKDIEKNAVDVARVLRGHLQTQRVTNADSGQTNEQRRVEKIVIMSGTESTYSINDKAAFTNTDSVHVTLNPESYVAMYGTMISGNRFKITAAESLSKVKIKVLMRGY